MEILGRERVEGLTVVHNELYESEDGQLRPRPTERTTTLPVGLVFRAIGYQGCRCRASPSTPWPASSPTTPGASSTRTPGEPVQGEYVVGWIKRGPQGIIGTNKPDSQETVQTSSATSPQGHLHKIEVPSRDVLERLLASGRRDFVSYEDWQLIDLLEQERGAATARPRVKFSKVEEMLHALQERKRAAAEEAADS